MPHEQGRRTQLSPAATHHLELKRRVLKAHPELRQLYGPQPAQVVVLLLLLVARWTLAWALGESPIWLIGLLACTVGCWLVHAAGTYAHESAHRLICASDAGAFLVDLLVEIAMTSFGKVVAYQYRHVNFHHRFLNEYDCDSEMRDACAHGAVVSAEDVSWLGSRALQLLEAALAALPLGGLVAQDVAEWLRAALFTPALSASDAVRKARFALPPPVAAKQRLFVLVSVCCYAASFRLLGWRSTLFALWSLSVKASRFDVVGWGQDAAEHNADADSCPTNSTYGLWNLLFCNTGYHAEHHSFPNVASCYLPRITAAAPWAFLPNENHAPYPALWLRWARAGFRSFRLSAEQEAVVRGGRCSARSARPADPAPGREREPEKRLKAD